MVSFPAVLARSKAESPSFLMRGGWPLPAQADSSTVLGASDGKTGHFVALSIIREAPPATDGSGLAGSQLGALYVPVFFSSLSLQGKRVSDSSSSLL